MLKNNEGGAKLEVKGFSTEVIDKKLPGTDRVASKHTARSRKAEEGKKVPG